ncbi:unnamed protein product [Penicillium salamii]|uniref:Uncharacterized protein n=1 Tax=Penicillium salamii TaxID=1612424 RepID=A0A9W4I5D6_9EURO|nr:unnamed protein product [Penicillium salamii]
MALQTMSSTKPTFEAVREIEETWDADDEYSDTESVFDPFEDFSSILIDLPEPQAIFKFHICRGSQPTLGTIDVRYPRGSRNRQRMVKEIRQWRPTWNDVRNKIRFYGYSHFSSEIPLAPVGLAIVRFPEENRSFGIEQSDVGVLDGSDVWALWRFIIEMPAGECKLFEVTLIDEA